MKLKNKPGSGSKNFVFSSNLWIGVGAAVLVFLLFLIPFINRFELLTLDYRFQNRPDHPVNPAIVLIGIDDVSLNKIGRWPWPRSYHGQMIEILKEAEAKVIGLDILFTEPSDDPAEDQTLAQAIAKSKNVSLPFFFNTPQPDPTGLFSSSQPINPVPVIKKNAAGVWQINVLPDQDGITRSVPLVIRANDQLHPTLGLGLALSYLNISPEKLKSARNRLEITDFQGKKSLIPIDRRGRMVVNFAGKPDCFITYPWEEVFTSYLQEKSGEKPAIPLNRFKNKIVLIGNQASGSGDVKPTSVSPIFPMFVLHANVLNNILEKDFLVRPNSLVRFLIVLALGLAVTAVVNRERQRLMRGVIFSGLLLIIYCLVALQLFNKNIWLGLAAPFSVVFLTCLSGTLNNLRTERREKNFIRSTFQRYVAPEVIDKLLSEKDAVNLGGNRRKVTILFADIHGFTPLSEKLPPEEVVELLNESLTVIAAAIFKYKGTLDKFIGDCVMAVFGAPLAQKNQELMAIKSALEMKKEIIEVSNKWSAKLGIKVEIGIGINTGEAVIGNIGSAERMDYTAIGDEVNLAQRLQSLTTAGQIMVSESTFRAVAESVSGTIQPPVQVKGKVKPFTFYEVHGLKQE